MWAVFFENTRVFLNPGKMHYATMYFCHTDYKPENLMVKLQPA